MREVNVTTVRSRLRLLLIPVALLTGCASEPVLAQYHWRSQTATVDEMDAAAGEALRRLGYIPIRHVSAIEYRARAVAAGDERHADVEPRPRAQALWVHVARQQDGEMGLFVDVLATEIPRATDFAREVAELVKERVTDLAGGGGVSTGLGYDPGQDSPTLQVAAGP